MEVCEVSASRRVGLTLAAQEDLVACDLAKLCEVKYPIIIPHSPGGTGFSSNSRSLLINSIVLCAFDDARTGVRHEISTTMSRSLKDIDIDEFQVACEGLQARVPKIISDHGISDFTYRHEVDLRYRGQATNQWSVMRCFLLMVAQF